MSNGGVMRSLVWAGCLVGAQPITDTLPAANFCRSIPSDLSRPAGRSEGAEPVRRPGRAVSWDGVVAGAAPGLQSLGEVATSQVGSTPTPSRHVLRADRHPVIGETRPGGSRLVAAWPHRRSIDQLAQPFVQASIFQALWARHVITKAAS